MTAPSHQEIDAPKTTTIPPIEDARVRGVKTMITPREIKEQLPLAGQSLQTVTEGREVARQIIAGNDPRMLVVVGPCSIHDTKAALEYASRLADLSRKVADRYAIVMRVYFEKPRTTVGWKGLINDPYLDESFDIAHGISVARKLLLDITAMGLPTATEVLDPIIPQYIADLISWSAIGARTTESQTHRELASGLSMPVGFKNGTDGGIQVAIDAMRSSGQKHCFLGIDQNGCMSLIKTSGNHDSHIVLRGGRSGPNYSPSHIAEAIQVMEKAKLAPAIMVDCSHANSSKDPERQPEVWQSILEQRANGRKEIMGAMIESHLHCGAQSFNHPSKLQYGVSITDGCIDWERTEEMLLQ